MLFILTFLALIVVAFNVIGFAISGPKYRGPVSDHFDGKKFLNPTGIKAKGLSDVIKWMVSRKRTRWLENNDFSFGPKPSPRVDNGVVITFVNHSTFLIQTCGLNILTDPVWSERTSPFSFMGPKRMRPAGIKLEDLPPIDLILLSHNHYDHLDVSTLKKLFEIHKPRIITPLGVKAFLEKIDVTGAVDLDWWDEYKFNDDIFIQATPAQHFSGRGTFDRDATLWCGYVIKRSKGNIYFAGDTGYNERTFKEIGKRCAPLSIAFIPIGAYKPEWFMSPIHCSPAEAVQMHLDLHAEQSIATHFGTFPLADDGSQEPVLELANARMANGITKEKFMVLHEGIPQKF